jgi:hypothetical protein
MLGLGLPPAPAASLQPPAPSSSASSSPSSHGGLSFLRKTNSQPNSSKNATARPKSSGGSHPVPESLNQPTASPATSSIFHPRAQSIPGPTSSGSTSGGSPDVAATGPGSSPEPAATSRLKTDEGKTRSKSGSPRQVCETVGWDSNHLSSSNLCKLFS